MYPVNQLFCMKLETAGWVVGCVLAVISFYLSVICIVGIILSEEVTHAVSKDFKGSDLKSSYLIGNYLHFFEILIRKESSLIMQLIFYLIGHMIFFGGCVSLIIGSKLRSMGWLEIWLIINILTVLFRGFNMAIPIFTDFGREKALFLAYKAVIVVLFIWVLNGILNLYVSIESETED